MSTVKEDYYKIIEDYVTGKISADGFIQIYGDKYLAEERDYDDDLFDILDRVFAETDLCTKDESLLKNFDFYIDENELFEGSKRALEELRALDK